MFAKMVADLEALKARFENAHWGQDIRDIASAVSELADHVHVMAQHLAEDAKPVVAEFKGDVEQLAGEIKADLHA